MPSESVKPSAAAASSEPPAELRLEGEVLGERYEIDKPLGEGGLGVVFRAVDRQTGRAVAVKVLRELYGAQRSFRRRFAREARALASLRHPHVVGIVDHGVTGEMPFLVMELLQGTTLADVLADQHTLPWERVRTLFLQLLDGLAYVHAQGLLHRDLKPGNVFLETTEKGERVKLLDFGLAKFVDGPGKGKDATLTKTGQLFGTPGYMPPEQYLGQPTDKRADLYSATLILYEMLAGERPFFGNLSEMAKQQLSGTVPPLQQLRPSMRAEPALQAWFERGLKPEPSKRFATVAELREAFEALPDPPLLPFGRPLKGKGDFSTDDTVLQGRPGRVPPPAEPQELPTKVDTQAGSRPGAAVQAAPSRLRRPRASSLLGTLARWVLILVATGLVVVMLAWRRLAPLVEPYLDGSTAPAATASGAEPAVTDAEDEPAEAPQPPQAEGSEEEAPPRWRAASRDPLRGAIPVELRAIRKHLVRGGKGNDKMIAALRRHNREQPNDPRGHLLLARMYFNRGWFSDGVRQYEFAVLRQPSARGDARMLPSLLGLHDSSAWAEAAPLIAETYGPEARRPIQRMLRSGKLAPASQRRLERLLERLPSEE